MGPRLLVALVLGVLLAAGAQAAPTATVTLLAQSAPAAGRPLNLSLSFSRLPDLQPIPTSAFVVSHEQLLHVVGVGADTFFHWHPTHKTPTAFLINGVSFPKAGTYLVAADGQLAQGSVANSSRISIPGTPAMGAAPNATAAAAWGPAAAGNSTNPTVLVVRSVPLQPQQQPAVSLRSLTVSPAALNATLASVSALGNASLAGLYTATLFGPQGTSCRPGTLQTYVWTLTRKVSRYNTSSSSVMNLPVSDLRPYYGAPMHLAVVRSDLGYIHHVHGEVVPAGRVADSNSSLMLYSSQAPGTNSTGGAASPGAAGDDAPSGSSGSNATAAAGMGHAGHGRHRAVLQAAATSATAHQVTNATAAGQSLAAGQAPIGSTPQAGGSDPGSMSADLFGPVLKTDVTFPSAGSYLMVGQMARGNELILVPVFVACTG